MDVHVPFIFSHLQVEEKNIYFYKNFLYIIETKKFTINIVISLCLGLFILSLFSLSITEEKKQAEANLQLQMII